VKTDAIDSLAGIMLSVKINDYICKNDTVMTLYSNDENKLKEAIKLANASFVIGNEKAEEKNIILKQF
jgi:thymidine phosphorylase